MVPYYLGAKAIAQRLGYKSPRMVTKMIVCEALPCYKRAERNRSGIGYHMAWCISESAVTAWEIARGQRFVAQRRAAIAKTKEAKRYALAG